MSWRGRLAAGDKEIGEPAFPRGRGTRRYLGAMSDAPKSALELAMERLKKKDADAGVEHTALRMNSAPPSPKHAASTRPASPSAGSCTSHRLAAIFDPQELELHREHLVRDLSQFESDRDAKIKSIRQRG